MKISNRTNVTLLLSILAAIASIVAGLIATVATSFSFLPSWSGVIWLVILTIITIGFGIFQVLSKAREVQEKRTLEQPHRIKITLEIDDKPITIETADTDRMEEILKLVQDLQADHSSSKVKAEIPEDPT